jgi:proteasome assembly chaperone 3
VFVVISQINKFGSMLKAWSEPKSEGGKIYQVSNLMGKRDDPLLHIYARQIIERLTQTTEKELLLAISLKPECRDTEAFQMILNELFQHNAWTA